MKLRIDLETYKGSIGSVRKFEDIEDLDKNVKSITDWIKSKFTKEELVAGISREITRFYEQNLTPSFIFMNIRNFEKIMNYEPYGREAKIYGLPVVPVPDLKKDFVIGVQLPNA